MVEKKAFQSMTILMKISLKKNFLVNTNFFFHSRYITTPHYLKPEKKNGNQA